MEYATLGRTGRRVSRLGFGGAPVGLKNYLHAYDPATAQARDGVVQAMRRALELGVNYFDTAPGYGGGASEEMIGRALEGERDVFVATKTGLWETRPVRQCLEESLVRLRRDAVEPDPKFMSAYTVRFPYDWQAGSHVHDTFQEMVIVLGGRLVTVVGSETLSVSPGDLVHHPLGVPNCPRSGTASPLTLVYFLWTGGDEVVRR